VVVPVLGLLFVVDVGDLEEVDLEVLISFFGCLYLNA